MPEGDTIFRAAARLRTALVGHQVRAVRAPRWSGSLPAPGETIDDVRSVGKHLLVDFSGGLTLRTHMRMTGSWHLYRPGERWRKAASSMRVALETDDWQAVCFLAPEVHFGRPEAADRSVGHLGPDLCQDDPDLDECVARFGLLDGGVTVAEALLDQRVCCGVGNVFKSEVCWAATLDPFTPVADVPAGLRRTLVDLAAKQLRANLSTSRRTTVPGGLAVYGRTGRPCRRCGTAIASREHGTLPRRTYWCPGCQRAPGPQVMDQ